nr:family 43 glycosylhydrolase [Streptomyces antimycoticus]
MPPHATRPWRAPAALLALLAALALVVPLTASRVHAAEHDRSHGSGRAVRQSTMVSRYLFTAFTNSGESNMYVYGSDDARDFWSVQDKAYTPPSGLVRDPSVIHRGGRYYVAYTTGWTGTTFGLAVSDDRRTWTHLADIDHGVAANNTWAPEFFTDAPDGKVRIVVSLSTGPTAYRHFQPYVLTALDDTLTKWSKPQPLEGISPSESDYNGYIDTFVVRKGATYHAFTKNATGELIEHAVADRITGPYRFTGKGDWAGRGGLLEGQTIVALPGGGYRMFLDGYTVKKYYYSDSADLEHWTPKQELPGLSGVVRHGTVIRETATVRPGDANPALPGYHADPDVMYAEGRYWIYPTEDGHPGWSGTRFNGFSSPDLVHWTDHGPVLDLADVSWCHENAWAPSVVRKGDTYWMYFSACQSIGVAKSANPGGRSPTRSANRSPPRGSSATSRSTRTPSSTTTAPPISTSGRAPSRRPG